MANGVAVEYTPEALADRVTYLPGAPSGHHTQLFSGCARQAAIRPSTGREAAPEGPHQTGCALPIGTCPRHHPTHFIADSAHCSPMLQLHHR